MKSNKIVTHSGLTLNLSEIKCFKLNPFNSIGKQNTLIVEFKKRYDYLEHPKTGELEKQEYNEQTEVEFPDYETAKVYADEWIDIWQDYLNE